MVQLAFIIKIREKKRYAYIHREEKKQKKFNTTGLVEI